MQSDPVAEALRAAAYALEHQDERKQGAATSWEELAAVAIAEFLRALPAQGLHLPLLDAPWLKTMGSARDWHARLAAAVERAARERG